MMMINIYIHRPDRERETHTVCLYEPSRDATVLIQMSVFR